MKLMILNNDGEVLDSVEITRAEFLDAQDSPLAAHCMVNELVVGSHD